jgi:hypothetical protein
LHFWHFGKSITQPPKTDWHRSHRQTYLTQFAKSMRFLPVAKVRIEGVQIFPEPYRC